MEKQKAKKKLKIRQRIKAILIIMLLILMVFEMVHFKKSNYYYFKHNEKVTLEQYNLYGESINLDIGNSYENEIELIDVNDRTVAKSVGTKETVDQGLTPSSYDVGKYYLSVNGKLVQSKDDIDLEYTTVPKNGIYYDISLDSNIFNILELSKKETNNTSYCDLIIDPGHGGEDVGAIAFDESYEKDYTLKMAKMLEEDLKKLDYNTCITRDEDINPGNIEDIDYVGQGGRVYQFYEKQPKYGISIHFNSDGGDGYQVYSSVRSSDNFARTVASKMKQVFHSSNIDNDYVIDNNLALLKRYIEDEPSTDYYYIIRETGGLALGNYNEANEYKDNIMGVETLLLELAYVDEPDDLDYIQDDKFMENYVNEIALGIDEYIQSK